MRALIEVMPLCQNADQKSLSPRERGGVRLAPTPPVISGSLLCRNYKPQSMGGGSQEMYLEVHAYSLSFFRKPFLFSRERERERES